MNVDVITKRCIIASWQDNGPNTSKRLDDMKIQWTIMTGAFLSLNIIGPTPTEIFGKSAALSLKSQRI